MISQTKLELKGMLQSNPLAELLAETAATNLTGSFRLADQEKKIIIYINNGNPVFAVSNQRRHRLFEILLQKNFTRKQITEIPNFTNDLELISALKSEELLSENEINKILTAQIEDILKDALEWTQGEWVFTPHARARENLQFKVELRKRLLEFARGLPNALIVKRFRSFSETYGVNPANSSTDVELFPEEAFVLSRFDKAFLKIDEIRTISGLPDVATLRTLYTLWLGGFLYRQNWNPAFSERKISEINSARLSLKKEEKPEEAIIEEIRQPVSLPAIPVPPVAEATPVQPVASQPEATDEQTLISLEDYLRRAENNSNYYELMGLKPDAELADIKRSYFALAKRFHPDRFHQEKGTPLIQRIQSAFTQMAQAYEALKNEDTRRTYDYKLSKYDLSSRKKSTPGSPEAKLEMASEDFERGFNFMMDEEYESALPFLARAVQTAPEVARYHAYYGKVLSLDEKLRHKAETEMQTALRLEPQNPTFRLIVAEFYIQQNLHRRAEGELQRLLSIQPNHKEALQLLATLHNS